MNAIEDIKQIVPSLNDEQIEAIVNTEGPLLIIAGPGTGKTLTLVLRALYLLIYDKAKPEEIILTTFTEKAAFELRDGIYQLAKKLDYKGQLHLIKIGTIHRLCNEFISKFLFATSLKKGYAVLDELTQQFFLYEHFDDIVAKDDKYLHKWINKWDAIKGLIPYFNKITEELIDPAKLEKSDSIFLKELGVSYLRYQNSLFENNRVDFSHLQKYF